MNIILTYFISEFGNTKEFKNLMLEIKIRRERCARENTFKLSEKFLKYLRLVCSISEANIFELDGTLAGPVFGRIVLRYV